MHTQNFQSLQGTETKKKKKKNFTNPGNNLWILQIRKKIIILPMQILTKRTHYRRNSYWID